MISMRSSLLRACSKSSTQKLVKPSMSEQFSISKKKTSKMRIWEPSWAKSRIKVLQGTRKIWRIILASLTLLVYMTWVLLTIHKRKKNQALKSNKQLAVHLQKTGLTFGRWNRNKMPSWKRLYKSMIPRRWRDFLMTLNSQPMVSLLNPISSSS